MTTIPTPTNSQQRKKRRRRRASGAHRQREAFCHLNVHCGFADGDVAEAEVGKGHAIPIVGTTGHVQAAQVGIRGGWYYARLARVAGLLHDLRRFALAVMLEFQGEFDLGIGAPDECGRTIGGVTQESASTLQAGR